MPSPRHASEARTPLAGEHANGATALLVVDMLSNWDFKDAEQLLPGALRVAPVIAALKARCRQSGVPVIYANDNHGRWRSDFRQIVRMSLAKGCRGAAIGRGLAPTEEDYVVLKPKQSAFFGTPLDLLLRHLRVRKLILTGVSSDQCILVTAEEAGMRDYQVVVPRDAVASQTAEREEGALRHLGKVLNLRTPFAADMRLPGERS